MKGVPILDNSAAMAALCFVQQGGVYLVKNSVGVQGRLIDFTDLSAAQKNKVLRWRNHESIRQWMYHPERITLTEHWDFIKGLVDRKDQQYLMVTMDGGELGVIDFLEIGAQQVTCSVGLYANPEIQRPGVGSQLMRIAIAYAQRVLNIQFIQLEVFAENNRALKLYAKFGFVTTSDKTVRHKKVLCMQLKIPNIIL